MAGGEGGNPCFGALRDERHGTREAIELLEWQGGGRQSLLRRSTGTGDAVRTLTVPNKRRSLVQTDCKHLYSFLGPHINSCAVSASRPPSCFDESGRRPGSWRPDWRPDESGTRDRDFSSACSPLTTTTTNSRREFELKLSTRVYSVSFITHRINESEFVRLLPPPL